MILSPVDRALLAAAMTAAVKQARRDVEYCRSYGEERAALEAKLAAATDLRRRLQHARRIEVD